MLRTSPGRHLEDVLKKGRREFHFRPTFLRRLCDVLCRLDKKTLQKEKMSALDGQRLANLTLQTLQGMETSQNFDLFFESVKKEHYRSIFYDATDTVIMAIKDRFE